MKKIFLLFCFFILISCAPKENFFELGIDNYLITVGKDNAEYLKTIYDFNLPEKINGYTSVKDVNISLINNFFGVASFKNYKKKEVPSDSAIIEKLTIYVNDLEGREIKINGEVLDSSIKRNCDKYQGKYIKRNGYACVIENNINDKYLNVIELYGDYLNINQDELDHLVVYVK